MKKRQAGRPLNPLDDPLSAFEQRGKVIIAGGSGFLGRVLTRKLEADGYEVVVLSRQLGRPEGRSRTVIWDGRTVGDWAEELVGAEAVVNLTGKSVACLYTPENKREIIASRVDSVRAIAIGCAMCPEPPLVIVQASSLAIYGDAGDQVCDENAPHGTGFSTEVCEAWEAAFFDPADINGPRRVALRIGFVLDRDRGALVPLTRLAQYGLGGPAGNGRQYISWLHYNDFCAMVCWAIQNPQAQGAYNATGLKPVTNAEFMRLIRRAIDQRWYVPTPRLAVKFGARFIMHVDSSLALTGRRCIPRRLLDEGFVMKHTDLDKDLHQLLWPMRRVPPN